MTVWRFASPPPETGSEWADEAGKTQILPELPACPPLRFGMFNEDLLAAYALCRAAQEEAEGRVILWERWAEIERAAHERLSGQ